MKSIKTQTLSMRAKISGDAVVVTILNHDTNETQIEVFPIVIVKANKPLTKSKHTRQIMSKDDLALYEAATCNAGNHEAESSYSDEDEEDQAE